MQPAVAITTEAGPPELTRIRLGGCRRAVTTASSSFRAGSTLYPSFRSKRSMLSRVSSTSSTTRILAPALDSVVIAFAPHDGAVQSTSPSEEARTQKGLSVPGVYRADRVDG